MLETAPDSSSRARRSISSSQAASAPCSTLSSKLSINRPTSSARSEGASANALRKMSSREIAMGGFYHRRKRTRWSHGTVVRRLYRADIRADSRRFGQADDGAHFTTPAGAAQSPAPSPRAGAPTAAAPHHRAPRSVPRTLQPVPRSTRAARVFVFDVEPLPQRVHPQLS